ncbi:MAG: hypothetical protein QXR58_03075 [Candidatus Micrarchaeaceae archaeon]
MTAAQDAAIYPDTAKTLFSPLREEGNRMLHFVDGKKGNGVTAAQQ